MDNVIVRAGAHNRSLKMATARVWSLNPINSYEDGRISDLKEFERLTFQSAAYSCHLSNEDSR